MAIFHQKLNPGELNRRIANAQECRAISRYHGGKGAGRSPSIKRRTSRNRVLAMATSTIWKVM
jgi:hypothetical protein